MAETTTSFTYHDALRVFLEHDASYGGGLSNHGPMAAEALVSIGADRWLASFVDHYVPRLEPDRHPVAPADADWRSWLAPQLDELVPRAGNLAGHGLLRVAHAVRGLAREEDRGTVSPHQRAELAAAVAYWRRGGPGIPTPTALVGTVDVSDWLATVELLPAGQRADGPLTTTLTAAASTSGFRVGLGAVAPGSEPATTLDTVALASMAGYLRTRALSAFALLHGATVSNMAQVLVPYLDPDGARRLESAVVGFVAAAVIGFDDREAPAAADDGSPAASADIADRAGATLEDHTIKFADACLGVAARTGATLPYSALERQIRDPYGGW